MSPKIFMVYFIHNSPSITMKHFFFVQCLCISLLCGAFSSEVKAQCGPLNPRWEHMDYGDVMDALEKSCVPPFSQKQQLFVAGVSRQLLEKCGLPSDFGSRMKLQSFLTSSTWAGIIGSEYANPNLGEGLSDQAASTAVFAAGAAAVNELNTCGFPAPEIARGVVAFLNATSEPENPSYVDGCTNYYSGRYSRAQCQCVADIGRAIYPGIHKSDFTPSSIYNIIQANPFIGLQIAFQCQIGDY